MTRPDLLTVLIVDDEEIVRQVLKEFLALLGNNVVEAEDGLSGIQSLENSSYDAAFVDIRMPGLDGMEFLKQSREKRPNMPVFLISGHGDDETRQKAIRAGALGFLNKPFTFDEIRNLMEKIVIPSASQDCS